MIPPTAEPRALDYRPRPRRAALVAPERLAEWLVGFCWTLCGTAALIAGVGWLFVKLDPVHAPWRVFAAACVAVNLAGFALGFAALFVRATYDRMLLTILGIALLIGAATFGLTYGFARVGLAHEPRARPAVAPLPAIPTDGEEDVGETEQETVPLP